MQEDNKVREATPGCFYYTPLTTDIYAQLLANIYVLPQYYYSVYSFTWRLIYLYTRTFLLHYTTLSITPLFLNFTCSLYSTVSIVHTVQLLCRSFSVLCTGNTIIYNQTQCIQSLWQTTIHGACLSYQLCTSHTKRNYFI